MNPLWLLGGLSGAGSLASLFMRDDPLAGYKQLMSLLNPDSINKDAGSFYRSWLASPAASQAQQSTLSAAAAGQSALNNSFAKTGLNMSGIGAMAPLGLAAGGLQLGKLHADAWNNALQNAMQMSQMRLSGLGVKPQFTGPGQFATLNDSLGRLLMAYWMQQNQTQPGTGWYPGPVGKH